MEQNEDDDKMMMMNREREIEIVRNKKLCNPLRKREREERDKEKNASFT